MKIKQSPIALSAALMLALSISGMSSSALAQDKLKINLLVHSASTNAFWQPVKRGMEEACKGINADCQLIFVQKEGDTAAQLRNLQTSIAQNVSGIVTTIVDNKAYDQPIAQARAKGIPVIAFNVDDLQGAQGNERQGFVGQSFETAGYDLGRFMTQHFPASGPVHVLVGISAPGQNWSETRGKGIIKALEEFKQQNPSRPLTWERLDSGTDDNITGQRVQAYVDRHAQTTAYIETGPWVAGAAQALKSKGVAAGKVLMGGFDLVPAVLDRIKEGYVQATVDQQPYLQGYLAVIQVAMIKRYKMSGWQVNTGSNLVTKDDVDAVKALVAKGYR